ncbi:Amidase [Gossypium australe]|uniref:Amidase n=1 Tax=Gossypium australe TaxID=47621 RepID=A0A5B6V9M6_9ROSI|nr:Amidase [Gossypium australe]
MYIYFFKLKGKQAAQDKKAVKALLFLQWFVVSVLVITTKSHDDFSIEEITIESIQRALAEDKLTSLQLVDLYLNRIQNLNPVLRSVLEINPHARVQAEEADRQRRSNSHHPRSFLHGVPALLKDTIATDDKLNTTAGSYALLGSVVGRDAGVVEKLRNIGAVILGKASLTEWYSFRALGKIPNGWCARGGQAEPLCCKGRSLWIKQRISHIRGRQHGDRFTFGQRLMVLYSAQRTITQ